MRPWYLLLLLSGCVVPQNVEQAPPAPSDQPPFVLATFPPQGTVTVARACSGLTFHVYGISDCDLQDSVEVHWLANSDATSTSVASNLFRSGPGGRSAGCTRDPGSDSWTLIPDNYNSPVLQVEALLSDGFESPVGRTASKDKLVYRVAWTVVLSPGPCLEDTSP